jgi:hypothetical protein
VCGFVAPPSKFQDPDVDLHQKLDLRQDQAPEGGDVNDLNADINDRDRDGLDDESGQPIGAEDELGADDTQPMVTCPACGYEAPAAEPQTVSTEDSVMGDAAAMPDESAGAASAGDLCPNCGQAPLMSPQEMAEAGLGAEPGSMPGEDEPDPEAVEDGHDDDNPFQQGPDDEDPEADPDADPNADEDQDGIPDHDEDADGDGIPDDQEDDDEEEDEDEDDDDHPFPPPAKKKPFPS